MSAVVLDTHAVIWYLSKSQRIPPAVVALIRRTINAGDPLYVSAISVLEVTYLVEKGRLPESALDRLVNALADPHAGIVAVPFDVDVALAARDIPREAVPDMPDRIIAATARHLGVPLVTRDHKIRGARIETVW